MDQREAKRQACKIVADIVAATLASGNGIPVTATERQAVHLEAALVELLSELRRRAKRASSFPDPLLGPKELYCDSCNQRSLWSNLGTPCGAKRHDGTTCTGTLQPKKGLKEVGKISCRPSRKRGTVPLSSG